MVMHFYRRPLLCQMTEGALLILKWMYTASEKFMFKT